MTIVFIIIIAVLFMLIVYLLLQNQKLSRRNYELKITLDKEMAFYKSKEADNMKIKDLFVKEFENISNKVIKMQKDDFDKEQRASLSTLLNPFQMQIRDFKELIEKTNIINANDKGALHRELEDLKRLNANLSKNADDLTNALKGNTKLQGDWGEHQLKTILSVAGFIDGIDYNMQFNDKNEEGRNIRPDCVIHLPNGKKLIVDSKVSITNYIDYVREEDEEKRKQYLKQHTESIKRHIQELSKKEYQKYLSDIDFVFMFIPNEQAYIEALKYDNNIYDTAYKSNVAITTPSSILPILRTIRNLWNIEKQNQNSAIIAQQAGKLYDKLASFIENMKKIDKGISTAREAYDTAFKQLSDGRGSAISIAEDLKDKGAKTIKEIKLDNKNYLLNIEE